MKAILLLVACLIGVSVEQNLFWPFPSQTRFQYLPQLMNQRADHQPESIANGKVQEREGKEASSYFYNNARYFAPYNPFYYYNYGLQADVSPQEQEGRTGEENEVQSRIGSLPAARFFFPGFFGGFGLMSTSYSFVSTVLTVTSTKFCTEASAFNATLSCRRRREALWELLEAPERIEPTQIMPVEPTPVAKQLDVPTAEQFEISGSLDQEVDQPSVRKARTFATVTTKTVTTIGSTTATTTVTSTVRSSAILLAGSKLQCLPVGAAIC